MRSFAAYAHLIRYSITDKDSYVLLVLVYLLLFNIVQVHKREALVQNKCHYCKTKASLKTPYESICEQADCMH